MKCTSTSELGTGILGRSEVKEGNAYLGRKVVVG